MFGRKSVDKDIPGFLRQQNIILNQLFEVSEFKVPNSTPDDNNNSSEKIGVCNFF